MVSFRPKTLVLLFFIGCALLGFLVVNWIPQSFLTADTYENTQSQLDTADQQQRKPGGNLSVKIRSRSLLRVLPKSQDDRLLLDIASGHSFFSLPWIKPPSSTTSRDGLGPLFNARNCIKCHQGGGRGRAPSANETMRHMLVRLSVPGENKLTNHVIPEPMYGSQFQVRGIGWGIDYRKNDGTTGVAAHTNKGNNGGVMSEVSITVKYKTLQGQYPDGQSYQLYQPEWLIQDLAYGTLSKDTLMSPRVGPSLVGMGLIGMIADADILLLVDENDTNNDGISGRVNQVWSWEHNKRLLGRFGLKSNTPTLRQQVADAFVNDIGITSSIFPKENCGEKQTSCLNASNGRGPRSAHEIDNEILAKVVNFVRYIPVPYSYSKTTRGEDVVKQGERHFQDVGCQLCHHASFTTKKSTQHELLSSQKIYPYSDFLLHDMGEKLADNRPDFQATGSEWRTAPLWGMKWRQAQGKFNNYLHDGRASTIEEAILWHGGEATTAKNRYMHLNKNQRTALLTFIESL